jgi:hypothetical protein
MVITKDMIFYTRLDDNDILDQIYLFDIVGVEDMDGKGPEEVDAQNAESGETEAVEMNNMFADAFQIRTSSTGYNRYLAIQS